LSDATIADDAEREKAARDGKTDRDKDREIKEVRATDIEPYTGLRYLSKLFRFMAVILVLLLVAEVVTGVYTQGSASIPTLLGEASRLIVLAGVLWGTGDLAHLLIDVGHDVRAARILTARVAHAAKVAPLTVGRPASERVVVERTRPTDDVTIASPRRNGVDSDDSGEGPPIP
jgi:hypothetical protein